MPSPQFENPALLKPFISDYDEQVIANPVIEIHADPNGTVIPNNVFKQFPPPMLSAIAISDRYPNHILTNIKPYAGDQRLRYIYRIMPAPWVYGFSFDANSRTFVFTKRRQNVAANIRPFLVQKLGTGATGTATLYAGGVAGVTISGSGTGYADFFGVLFSNPPAGGVTAEGYGTALNGVPQSIVVTQPGSGYMSAPTATLVGDALVEVVRQDIDANLAWEIVTILQMTWEEQVSIGIKEDEILYLTAGGIVFVEVDGIGTSWFPTRAARTRQVQATVQHWLSVGETMLPLPAPTLKNGKTVINSDTTGTSTNILLWNPQLVTYDGFLGFKFSEVITDSFAYTGTWNGITLPSFTIPASVPSATKYATEIAAANFALKEFESVPMRGNIFSNRAIFFPIQ